VALAVRPREDASEMPIRAQKTDALVPVQIHSEYRRIIEAGKPAQLEQFSTFRLSTAVVENTQEMALRGPVARHWDFCRMVRHAGSAIEP